MKNRNTLLFLMAALAGATIGRAQSHASCANLRNLKIAGVEITNAVEVAAGAAIPPSYPPYTGRLPAHCRVEGVIHRRKGVGGEEFGIGFALALPENWNGDFMMQGGGGANGVINYPTGAGYAGNQPGLDRGFVVASTDTGHKAKTGIFDFSFTRDQQAYLDFAYLADAEVAAVAKQIISRYYRKPSAYSYFVGCSTGGREGMILSQRYPGVFNGIVVGDPAMRTGFSNLAISQWIPTVYNAAAPKDASGRPEISKLLTPGQRNLFMDALMKKCDGLDGVVDGMILNPLGCHFDPAALSCKAGQTQGCIAPKTIAAIKKAFGGPKLPDGTPVYPGFLYDAGIAPTRGFPGLLTMGPRGLFGPYPTGTTIDVAKLALRASQPLVDSTATNLSTFSADGSKLIFFHGDSDPWFSPLDTLEYYQSMAAANGGLEQVENWSRFFFVPGMSHCGGGPSLDHFDMLTAIVNWVEKGAPPERVIATGRAFPGRSRPLCPYPEHAQYKGSGNTDDAANFICER